MRRADGDEYYCYSKVWLRRLTVGVCINGEIKPWKPPLRALDYRVRRLYRLGTLLPVRA